MDEFRNINALMVQRRKHCAIISMNVYSIMDALMVQLGTSCSFDSPGLARNEPTPAKRSQGDSWRITQRIRNTDGVVPHTTYTNPA